MDFFNRLLARIIHGGSLNSDRGGHAHSHAGEYNDSVSTSDALHDYRVEIDGIRVGADVRLYQDDALILNTEGVHDPDFVNSPPAPTSA